MRANGFYWVRREGNDRWEVARWSEKSRLWCVTGETFPFLDPGGDANLKFDALAAIDETPIVRFERLEVKPGDLLIVRVPSNEWRTEHTAKLRQRCEALAAGNTVIMLTDQSIETLNDEQLAALGLQRKRRCEVATVLWLHKMLQAVTCRLESGETVQVQVVFAPAPVPDDRVLIEEVHPERWIITASEA